MPVATDKAVRKVFVAHWLDMLDVDDFPQSSRVDDLFDSLIIRAVTED